VVKFARCLLAFVLAESTKAVYASAVANIKRFCEQHSLHLSFPIPPETVALWMAYSSTKLVYSTIRVYLHGVASAHVELGAASPLESKLVWRMFKAIKRLQGARAGKQKLPITAELLHDLEPKQQYGTLAGLSKRAAMWLGTCGLLRSGEFATRPRGTNTLLRKHLVFLDERMQPLADPTSWASAACMRVHLAASKTDPFRQGVDIIVSNDRAIAAMVQYLHSRGVVDDDQPLLIGDEGKALSVNELVRHTRATLLAAGISDAGKYAGHSFRRGGATSLHLADAPDSLIRIMGRWRSFTFARYVDVHHDKVIAAGRSMTALLPSRARVRFAIADDCKSLQHIWD
jgi:hypothetical protein